MEQPNPYAAPIAQEVRATYGGEGVWRDGDVAVCHKDAPWPDRCVKCNDPAEGYRLKRGLYWHPPWVYVTLLAGVLVYVVIALVVRKSATLYVGMCPKHRSRRRTGLLVGWLGVIASIGTCSFGFKQHDPGAMLGLGTIGFFVFAIVGFVAAQLVRPKKIDDTHAWVRCGRSFVESLPPAGGQPRW